MTDVATLRRDLLAAAGQLARLVDEPAPSGGAAQEVHAIVDRTADALRALADEGLGSSEDARAIRRGVAAARAAIALEPGSRALRDVGRADGRGRGVLLALASQQCLAALLLMTEAE